MKINPLILLGLTMVYGAACAIAPVVSSILVLVVLVLAAFRIFQTKNEGNLAAIAAGFFVGSEILLRVSSTFLFHEFAKYASGLILILGLIAERPKHKISLPLLFYFLLLLPSILMYESFDLDMARRMISADLSGPFILMASSIYFYNRKTDSNVLKYIMMAMLLGMLPTIFVNTSRMPSFDELNFNLSSNKSLSGGFGPNQVSTALGFGFMAIGIGWLAKIKIFGSYLLDRLIGFVLMTFALITFSRGGVLTPIVTIFIGLLYSIRASGDIRQLGRVFNIVALLGVSGVFLWNFVNGFTNNALEKRYLKTVKDVNAEQSSVGKGVISTQSEIKINVSGRDRIYQADFQVFREHPILGVGPGNSVYAREKILGARVAPHTEFTRVLAEHGLYGIISLLIFFVMPFTYLRKLPTPTNKVVLICFFVFSALTQFHAAMRLSLPGFTYGLAFLVFDKQRKSSLQRSTSAEHKSLPLAEAVLAE